MLSAALLAAMAPLLAFVGPSPQEAPSRPACRFQGKAPTGLGRSRADACRAVLEGLGEDTEWKGPLTITLTYAPPAHATVTLVEPGHPRAPISIALGDQAIRRRDFVALGRTIAQLLRAY